MSVNGFHYEFETDENDFDTEEQKLDDEADWMLRMWDRKTLMKEVDEQANKQKHHQDLKEKDFYDGETEFKDMLLNMKSIGSGQVFMEMVEENPDGKLIKASDTILFDRIGYLEFEVTPFESSVFDGKPTKMSLADGSLVRGLLLALIHMREGEAANVMIKPSMGFGPLGCPPLIPEEAWLFYHIKIYKSYEMSELNEILDYENKNHLQFPLQDKLQLVEDHKRLANQYLIDDQVKDALVMYKSAIKCLDEVPEPTLRAHEDIYKIMVVLLQNASIAMNRLGYHKSATKAAKRSLFMDPTNIKAYYQLIKARIGLEDYSGAIIWIERAEKRFPNSRVLLALRVQLDFYQRQENLKRLDIMKKMSQAFKQERD